MTRPPLLAYLFGNSLVYYGFGIGLWWFGYRFFATGTEMAGFALCAIGGAIAYKPHVAIARYKAWRREWRAMNGAAAAPVRRTRRIRAVLGVGIWALLGLALFAGDKPAEPTLAALYLASWGLIAFGALARLSRMRAAPKQGGDVALCVKRPRQSSHAEQLTARLPPYCVALMAGAPATLAAVRR